MSVSVITVVVLTLGFALHLTALFSPNWRVTEPSSRVRQDIYQHEGIWIRCTAFPTGNFDCDDYNRYILGLPTQIQVGRIVGILGMLLGFGSLATLAVSLECTPFPKRTKTRLKITGYLLSTLSGLGIIIITGYFANMVLQNYWLTFNRTVLNRRFGSNNTFIFGWSLYVGWAGGAIQLVVGLLSAIIVFCRKEDRNEYRWNNFHDGGTRNFAYRPENPAPTYGKHYV